MTDEEVSDDVSEVEDAIVDDGVKGVKEDSVELSLDDAGIREITLEDELMELVLQNKKRYQRCGSTK
jgi:hypothetical protein